MQNPKALFFVDDNQAEVFEKDVAGNQPVRADDDIDAAFAQQQQTFLLFGLRTKTTEHLDSYGIIEHALTKHLEMLLRENGRRREYRDLFAVHHGFEGGANRDFGLAEADIAANQAVHRLRMLHVDFRVDDRLHLIGRFTKRKRVLKFRLPFGI